VMKQVEKVVEQLVPREERKLEWKDVTRVEFVFDWFGPHPKTILDRVQVWVTRTVYDKVVKRVMEQVPSIEHLLTDMNADLSYKAVITRLDVKVAGGARCIAS